ncbi:alpha-amylase, partial [bacterium]|nr:alpha-amylase [candidate division CSSED10-310 bacterium]
MSENRLARAISHFASVSQQHDAEYRIPGLWRAPYLSHREVNVNPAGFIRDVLTVIAEQGRRTEGCHHTAADLRIYSCMVRLAAAYDHDGDGRLGGDDDPTLNRAGHRETGTFLKLAVMLPYIRSMGLNTLHLLPITEIGGEGRKGILGSPYAIRDPYRLEPGLADPLLPWPVEEQFALLVEAAHCLDMKVVLEFVLRTASRDSRWIKDHPDWFYWIDAGLADRLGSETGPGIFGSPVFRTDELERIKEMVYAGTRRELIPPPKDYQALFH